MRTLTAADIQSHFLETEKHAATLERWWEELLPDLEKPSIGQFIRWARIHNNNLTALRYAFERAEARNRIRKFNDPLHPISWISATANNYRHPHQLREAA
jgi:hypothetical protein